MTGLGAAELGAAEFGTSGLLVPVAPVLELVLLLVALSPYALSSIDVVGSVKFEEGFNP